MSWLRTRRAPSAGASYNTGASSQYSRPDPRPMVFDLLALLSWCCRASRRCSFFLAGGYSVPFTPGPSTVPQFLVHISGFCPGHEILALVRPVVPYTLSLSSKRSRSVVSPAECALQQRSLPTDGHARAPIAGWLFVSRKLHSPSQT